MKQSISSLSITAQEARFGWILIIPSMVAIFGLILYPILFNIYLSFNEVSLMEGNTFIGFLNYREILTEPGFWKSMLTSLIYVLFSTIGTTLLGLGVALVMNREFPLRALVRSLILLPYVAPVISVVFSWQFFFDPVQGPFIHFMYDTLGWFRSRVNLIGDPEAALWIAIIFNMWRSFPFTYLMILSRLQAIDENLYEAAEIDGAGGWQKFRYITLPEIYFVVGAMILIRFIWNFNKFEDIYLLTDNVRVLPVYTYFKAFVGTQDLGQASAIAVVQFIVLVGIILIYVKRVLKW